jgi:hypothetical protein
MGSRLKLNMQQQTLPLYLNYIQAIGVQMATLLDT